MYRVGGAEEERVEVACRVAMLIEDVEQLNMLIWPELPMIECGGNFLSLVGMCCVPLSNDSSWYFVSPLINETWGVCIS